MKKFIALITFALAFSLAGAPFTKKDAKKDWQGYDMCKVRCEKAYDCISKKRDSGPNGRTACSEKCDDLCDAVDTEMGGGG